MKFGIQLVTLVVKDYDEAISFFVDKLGFVLVQDKPSTTSVGNRPKRWVVIRPPGVAGDGSGILLAQADSVEQQTAVGNQFAGRVGMFWHVENFEMTYQKLHDAGVQFVGQPENSNFGRFVVFLDVAGNKWDLIGPVSDLSTGEGEAN